MALALGICCLALAPVVAQQAAAPTNEDCMACHSDPDLRGAGERSVAVDAGRLAASIHGQVGVSCVDCHSQLAKTTEYPHPEELGRPSCTPCHEEAVQAYQVGIHSQSRTTPGDAPAAWCSDCHGIHDILPSADPESRTYHLNLPGTCGSCHQNDEMVRMGRIPGSDVSRFQDSIHGVALSRAGLLSAPNCADCHGFHDIRPPTDPSSRVYRDNVPETCGSCHEGIERQYGVGVHGTALENGNPIAPTCSTCHTAHAVTRTESESWQLQVLAECGGCHVEAIRTYRDTFHGQVTRLGFVRVATCASCHGAHDILPGSNPLSRVSEQRLVETCGTCHPGSNESFVQYDPHADRHNPEKNPLLYYASIFMETLLAGVFLFFGVHTALWFTRTAPRRRQRGPAPGREEAGEAGETQPGEGDAAGDDQDGGDASDRRPGA